MKLFQLEKKVYFLKAFLEKNPQKTCLKYPKQFKLKCKQKYIVQKEKISKMI